MIRHWLHTQVQRALTEVPAVCLVGLRQAWKTRWRSPLLQNGSRCTLNLESPQDRAKLQDAEAYLERHRDKLVILDELYRMPELLPLLRSPIDRGRRAGQPMGQYLLLGSASLGLLRHVGEALMGRAVS
ncbi:MAG: AAA family ATPase [Candidatus Kapabacteria bacterium]|nr:AAA family ATPase [Candidatus Kapabacteria bacterium]MDW8012712.1 AAA family ATPase [Bacteroidota bacterium]